MSGAGSLGVVVAGLGRAGNVRMRDLGLCQKYKPLSNVKLVGFVSRRAQAIENVPQLTLDEAVSRDDVHFVLVCTENQRHEQIARAALQAKKHVLVEYPLALNAEKAKGLMELAAQNGVTCYEEDIALLTEEHIRIKKAIAEKPPLKEGYSTLNASFNGWIENFDESGSPFHTSMHLLHTLTDMFGPLTPVEASITRTNESFSSKALVHTADGKPLTINTERGVGKTRSKDFCFTFEDGTKIEPTPQPPGPPQQDPSKPGIFMQDLIHFAEVTQGTATPMTSHLTIPCLELADKLYQMAKENKASSGI